MVAWTGTLPQASKGDLLFDVLIRPRAIRRAGPEGQENGSWVAAVTLEAASRWSGKCAKSSARAVILIRRSIQQSGSFVETSAMSAVGHNLPLEFLLQCGHSFRATLRSGHWPEGDQLFSLTGRSAAVGAIHGNVGAGL